MVKIYQGNTHCKFTFDTNKEEKQVERILNEKFTAYDSKLEHTIMVKRRLATPHINFYNEEHKILPTGLIPWAKAYFRKDGIEFEQINLKKPVEPDTDRLESEDEWVFKGTKDDKPFDYVVRQDQIDALRKITEYNGGVLQAATGFGKGFLLCVLTKVYPKAKFLIICKDIQNTHQTRENFIKYGFDEDEIGVIQGNNFQDDRRITILCVSSYEKAQHIFPTIDVIISDECHTTMKSNTSEKIIFMCQNAGVKVGLSATPDKHDEPADKMRMYSLGGPVIGRYELIDQINKGVLANAEVDIYKIGDDANIPIVGSWNDIYDNKRIRDEEHRAQLIEDGYEIVRVNGRERARKFEEHGDESLTFIYNEERNRLIAELASKNKRVLMLYDKKRHRDEMLKYLPEAVNIDGSDSLDTRYEAMNYLATDENSIVLASGIWNAGIDIPSIQTIIMVNSVVSTINIIQRLGRGVRKDAATGKEKVKIIDFEEHWNPLSRKQSRKRIRVYRNELKLPVRIIE